MERSGLRAAPWLSPRAAAQQESTSRLHPPNRRDAPSGAVQDGAVLQEPSKWEPKDYRVDQGGGAFDPQQCSPVGEAEARLRFRLILQ